LDAIATPVPRFRIGRFQKVLGSHPLLACTKSITFTTGALSDIYGRKRLFLGAVVLFTATSLGPGAGSSW